MIKSILKDVEKMNLVTEGDDFRIYEDDASGDRFEVDYDDGVAVHIHKINEGGEILFT